LTSIFRFPFNRSFRQSLIVGSNPRLCKTNFLGIKCVFEESMYVNDFVSESPFQWITDLKDLLAYVHPKRGLLYTRKRGPMLWF
jgi:hypothetical protein